MVKNSAGLCGGLEQSDKLCRNLCGEAGLRAEPRASAQKTVSRELALRRFGAKGQGVEKSLRRGRLAGRAPCLRRRTQPQGNQPCGRFWRTEQKFGGRGRKRTTPQDVGEPLP